MARKQNNPPKPANPAPDDRSADRHASPFMIRLPEVYQRQLRELKRRTRLPMTAATQLALEDFLARHGLWPPTELP